MTTPFNHTRPPRLPPSPVSHHVTAHHCRRAKKKSRFLHPNPRPAPCQRPPSTTTTPSSYHLYYGDNPRPPRHADHLLRLDRRTPWHRRHRPGHRNPPTPSRAMPPPGGKPASPNSKIDAQLTTRPQSGPHSPSPTPDGLPPRPSSNPPTRARPPPFSNKAASPPPSPLRGPAQRHAHRNLRKNSPPASSPTASAISPPLRDQGRLRYQAHHAGEPSRPDCRHPPRRKPAPPARASVPGKSTTSPSAPPTDAQQALWLDNPPRRWPQTSSPVMDRDYFHSIYFPRTRRPPSSKSPPTPPASPPTNPPPQLGTHISLPPWLGRPTCRRRSQPAAVAPPPNP